MQPSAMYRSGEHVVVTCRAEQPEPGRWIGIVMARLAPDGAEVARITTALMLDKLAAEAAAYDKAVALFPPDGA